MLNSLRKPFLACAALFAVALLGRVAFIGLNRFDGLYGQDAFAYFTYARTLLQSTRALQLPPQFTWPLGYPALIAIAFSIVGVSPLSGQLVSIITGALVSPLVYLLTRDILRASMRRSTVAETPVGEGAFIRSDAGAIVAGLIAAVSGQLVQSSIVIMADAPATFWAMLSALALLRYARTGGLRWWFVSALTLLFALLTRWLFGALILPWSVMFLYVWWRAPGTLADRLRGALIHGALPILCALPLMFAQWRALVPSTSLNHAWVAAWNIANAVGRSFNTPDGHFDYPLPVGVFYAQPLLHPFYLFPLLLPFLIIGLWALRRCSPTARIVLLGWPLSVYVFLLGIPYENFRFGLALWPPLAALTGVGFDWLWGRLPGRRATRALMSGIAAISLLAMVVWTGRGLDPIIGPKNETLAVVRAVSAQVPVNSTIIALGLGGFFSQYEPGLNYVELYDQSSATLDRFVCTASPVFLLIEPDSLATQWANREPDLNVRYLREHAGLTELRKFGALTLYQVGAGCA